MLSNQNNYKKIPISLITNVQFTIKQKSEQKRCITVQQTTKGKSFKIVLFVVYFCDVNSRRYELTFGSLMSDDDPPTHTVYITLKRWLKVYRGSAFQSVDVTLTFQLLKDSICSVDVTGFWKIPSTSIRVKVLYTFANIDVTSTFCFERFFLCTVVIIYLYICRIHKCLTYIHLLLLILLSIEYNLSSTRQP